MIKLLKEQFRIPNSSIPDNFFLGEIRQDQLWGVREVLGLSLLEFSAACRAQPRGLLSMWGNFSIFGICDDYNKVLLRNQEFT